MSITLTWHSESQNADLAAITVRDVMPVSSQLDEHWWEVAIAHRGVPAAEHTVAAADWPQAVNIAVGRTLATAHPELVSVLLLLVPNWVNDLA